MHHNLNEIAPLIIMQHSLRPLQLAAFQVTKQRKWN